MTQITEVKEFGKSFADNIGWYKTESQTPSQTSQNSYQVTEKEVTTEEIVTDQVNIPTPGTVAYFKYMENHNWEETSFDKVYSEILTNINSYEFTATSTASRGNYIVPSEDDYSQFLSFLKDTNNSYYKTSKERQEKYGVDNVYLYYNLINQQYGDKLTFEQKLQLAINLEPVDKGNNYSIAHSIPIIEEGTIEYSDTYCIDGEKGKNDEWYSYEYTGKYLHFFNENGTKVTTPVAKFEIVDGKIEEKKIANALVSFDGYELNRFDDYVDIVSNYYIDLMNQSLKYSDDYREKSIGALSEANFLSVSGAGYYGVTYGDKINFNLEVKNHEQMMDVFHHELAHEYSRNAGDLSYSKDWKKIYNKINWTDNINLIYDVYCNTPKSNPFISFLKLLDINDIEKIISHYFNEGIIISDCKIFVNKSGVFDKISFNVIEKNKKKIIGGNYGK